MIPTAVKQSIISLLSFQRKYNPDATKKRIAAVYTPIDQAVTEIQERRQDLDLIKRVTDFLNDDIPEHLDRGTPVFYISRYLATPNHELLYAIERAKPFKLPLVVSQDTKGKFVSNNELKCALAKLPVVKGVSRNQDVIIENFTIVDFTHNQGKTFDEIETKIGVSLVDFHNILLQEMSLDSIIIGDETQWVDRNFREDIAKQYEKVLALLCVHGIMFEAFPPGEYDFAKEVMLPAFKKIEKTIGVRPLVVEHITEEEELARNWNSYPSVLYQYIKRTVSDNT